MMTLCQHVQIEGSQAPYINYVVCLAIVEVNFVAKLGHLRQKKAVPEGALFSGCAHFFGHHT